MVRSTSVLRAAREIGAIRLALALSSWLAIATACSSDDGGGSASDGSASDGSASDATVGDGSASDATVGDGSASDAAAKVNTLMPDGDYLVGLKLKLGGVQLIAKAAIVAVGEAGKGGTLQSIDLYGAHANGYIGTEPFAAAKAIAVAADGSFSIDFGKVVVPGEASPTFTPVPATLKLVGTIGKEGDVCGQIEGYIPDFEADLKGSTFAIVPWKQPLPENYPVACAGQGGKVYEPIKTCPALKAGTNTITSATFERTFELQLPAAATATGAAKLPIVVLYHGNTGNAKGISADTGWPAVAGEQAILVVPNTTPLVDGSKPVLDWRYAEKAFDLDNRELVLFDDLLTCVGKQFAADLDRVYVTGMSAGGMMTTFLSVHRSAKIAAAAPLSGGYLHPWPTPERKVPMLFTWGGPTDEAYGQDFHKLANTVLKTLSDNKHVHVSCDHGKGHKIPSGFATHQWQWFQAFKRTSSGDPHKGALPAGFPSYCKPSPVQ